MLDQVASILKTDSLSERNSCQSHTSTCEKALSKCVSVFAIEQALLDKGMPVLGS